MKPIIANWPRSTLPLAPTPAAHTKHSFQSGYFSLRQAAVLCGRHAKSSTRMPTKQSARCDFRILPTRCRKLWPTQPRYAREGCQYSNPMNKHVGPTADAARQDSPFSLFLRPPRGLRRGMLGGVSLFTVTIDAVSSSSGPPASTLSMARLSTLVPDGSTPAA